MTTDARASSGSDRALGPASLSRMLGETSSTIRTCRLSLSGIDSATWALGGSSSSVTSPQASAGNRRDPERGRSRAQRGRPPSGPNASRASRRHRRACRISATAARIATAAAAARHA